MIETSLNRLQWSFRIILLAIAGTLVLSSKVWVSERNFPLVPIISWVPSLPSPLDYILYCIVIVLCIYLLVNPGHQKAKHALILLFAFMMLPDQMRWQPYTVHYLLMLIGFYYFPLRTEGLLNVFRLMLVTVLVWSGIQELNETYAESIFPAHVALHFAEKFPSRFEGYITGCGYLFALLQVGAGVGLLFDRVRNYAIGLATLIYLFLIYSADRLSFENEPSIPYYRAVSLALVYVLFYKAEFSVKEILWSKRFRYHQLVFIFFSVLPVLSFAGLYDRTQSFANPAGKMLYARIFITEALAERLPEGMKRYVDRLPGMDPYIDATYWSWKELKVSPYAEERVYKRLHEYICSFEDGECSAVLNQFTYN